MSDRSARLEDLRSRYPVFVYEDFELRRTEDSVIGRFHFRIPPDLSFSPEVAFQIVPEGWNSVPAEFLDNVIFHLGLIELFSYWKATASSRIEVRAGQLNTEQIAWWEDLLIHGMGEFFYSNDIDFTSAGFVQIRSMSGRSPYRQYSDPLPRRSLLTIGGGRDSALAAGLLRSSQQPFTCMMLNPSSAARAIALRVTPNPPVIIRRSICPELLELNRRGFLNGHTPFSAYLAFLSAACMLLYGYSNVIVANERSSDEGNVVYRGYEINHQYSKTFRFETQFDEYLSKYLLSSGRYFSLIRPLYELQIAKLFSGFPELFPLFKSCNRNRSDSWCGRCPKCLSVFITMYPFLSRPELLGIFGSDLFLDKECIPILRQLTGIETKPFECVGTTQEMVTALSMAVDKVRNAGEVLPPLLQYAVEQIGGVNGGHAVSDVLASYGPHRIPSEFESRRIQALKESPRSL